MVKLLECQKYILEEFQTDKAEELRLFAIALICSLLDTFETDLSPQELVDIRRFAKDWCKK